MEDQITLLRPTKAKTDDFGIDQVSAYSEKNVLCTVHSASRSEFYQAAQAGRKPEFEMEIFAGDYDGEPLARYDGRLYDVVRTYRPQGDDYIILTLERKIGETP